MRLAFNRCTTLGQLLPCAIVIDGIERPRNVHQGMGNKDERQVFNCVPTFNRHGYWEISVFLTDIDPTENLLCFLLNC